MQFHGVLRIRNEARWIERVIRSIQPLCGAIHVLDDHSTDGTPDICERIEGVKVYRSEFQGLDEARDRDFLLQRVIDSVPWADVNENSPHYVVAIDGDEVLEDGGADIIRETVARGGFAWKLKIVYLWDSDTQWRCDGVYRNFARPSVFRLINPGFRYQRTPWGDGANFHCSSIPQEMLHHGTPCDARLLHLGYRDQADRLRKFEWYSRIDPNNEAEDCYRHMVQGDIPEVPAGAHLKWAGPLQLAPL